MKTMQYRHLGRSGLQVSEIGLGSWLTYGHAVEESNALKCLDKAYELGINFFDTADVYNRGEAEQVLGKFLSRVERRHLILATKAYFPMSEHWMDRGLSFRHVMNACRASLDRLRTEYIDLYQCHRYDYQTPLEETCYAMHRLVEMGWIYHWGVSQWTAPQILRAIHLCEKHGWTKPVSNQPIYNLLNRSLEVEVMQICEEEDLGLAVFSPLAQGVLTGKYGGGEIPDESRAARDKTKDWFAWKRLSEDNLAKVEKLTEIATRLNLSMPQLALAWVLRKAPVSTAIIGASKPEQIEDNLGAVGQHLPDEVLAEIEEVMQNHPTDQYTGQLIGHGVDPRPL